MAAAVGNHAFGAMLRSGSPVLSRQNHQGTATTPAPTVGATGPGAYIPHRYCRNDGPPPNASVVEDQATCEALLIEATAALARQRRRADAMVGGPNGPVHDFRYFFARVYSYVTENEIRFVRERAYYYPSYVLRSVLYFEKIYEDNFRAWDRQKGGDRSARPEDHWRIAFQRADDAQRNVAMARIQALASAGNPVTAATAGIAFMATSVMESARALTEGMKAHIRWDLPRAEAWVFNQHYASMPGVGIRDFMTDFMSMSGVFDDAGRVMQDDMARKLGIPVNLMPALVQDTTMRHMFDADMATERADTWRRAEVIQGSAGTGPYSPSAGGGTTGDVTTSNNRREIDSLTPASLRPNMDDSAARRGSTSLFGRLTDDEIRARVSSLGRSGLRSTPAVERVQMVRGLLSGATFDEDEDAILTIMNASVDAGDFLLIVEACDAWDMLYALDGSQYTDLRQLLIRQGYYAGIARLPAVRLIRKCLEGETANWEEDMVTDILEHRGDAGEVVRLIGRAYPTGPDELLSGLNKLEWQLDDDHEALVRARMGALGLPQRSGYTFRQ